MIRSMRSTLNILALSFVLAVPVLAQDAEELQFLRKQAKALNAYASSALRAGLPQEAKLIWLEILAEYDNDDADARKNLGFIPSGKAWAPDKSFSFPMQSNPDVAAAKRQTKAWSKLCKEVGKAHQAMAVDYEAAGRSDRSQFHWQRVLRFVPESEEAQVALGMKDLAGNGSQRLRGTDLEQVIYERSTMLEEAVERELRKEYAVQRQEEGATHPYLEKAELSYIGVKSENFQVWGDWDEETLKEAAMFAERSLAFCRDAYAGYDVFGDGRSVLRHHVFLREPDDFRKVLTANRGLVPNQAVFDLMMEDPGGYVLGSGSSNGMHIGIGRLAAVFDRAVRGVAQDFANFHTDALTEGIGHAVVGRFFGRNLIYIINVNEKEFTVVGDRKIPLMVPDMESWSDLAVEAAYDLAGTPAARLPLLNAAQFPDDARIKSWSFADYLLRRDPALLRHLDKTRKERNAAGVRKLFVEKTKGLSLDHLEQGWRDFWTGKTPVLKALRNKVSPLEASSKDAPKWLRAFNDKRAEMKVSVVSWNASFSQRCRNHVHYLKANSKQRGPALEHMQDQDLEHGTRHGNLFAQMAVVNTQSQKPAKVMQAWMALPGYRDAILNSNLLVLGMYAEGPIMVMDTLRGSATTGSMQMAQHPTYRAVGVPRQVQVKELGPEVQRLLDANGEGRRKILGYPLSLHFFGSGLPRQRESIQCQLFRGEGSDKPVPGILHLADQGSNRRASAPGLAVFYPLAPLKGSMRVEWTYVGSDGEPRRLKVQFATR